MFHKFQTVTAIALLGLCAACGEEPVTYNDAFGDDPPSSSAEDVGVDKDVGHSDEDPEDTTGSIPIAQTDSSIDSASAAYDVEDTTSQAAFETDSEDTLTETGEDRDTSSYESSPKDGPAGNGEACWVNVLGLVNIEGRCRSLLEPCLGGTYPLDIRGNCILGQVCCIAVDQCNKHKLDIVTCREHPCPAFGAQVGCPDGGWCCIADL